MKTGERWGGGRAVFSRKGRKDIEEGKKWDWAEDFWVGKGGVSPQGARRAQGRVGHCELCRSAGSGIAFRFVGIDSLIRVGRFVENANAIDDEIVTFEQASATECADGAAAWCITKFGEG